MGGSKQHKPLAINLSAQRASAFDTRELMSQYITARRSCRAARSLSETLIKRAIVVNLVNKHVYSNRTGVGRTDGHAGRYKLRRSVLLRPRTPKSGTREAPIHHYYLHPSLFQGKGIFAVQLLQVGIRRSLVCSTRRKWQLGKEALWW